MMCNIIIGVKEIGMPGAHLSTSMCVSISVSSLMVNEGNVHMKQMQMIVERASYTTPRTHLLSTTNATQETDGWNE